jgi:hypothetical protein
MLEPGDERVLIHPSRELLFCGGEREALPASDAAQFEAE